MGAAHTAYQQGPLGSVPNVGGGMPMGSGYMSGGPGYMSGGPGYMSGGPMTQMQSSPNVRQGQDMMQSGQMGVGQGPPPLSNAGQYMPNVSRPQMTAAANPPIMANNIAYGPSYKMQYQRRSTADKTAVKYTGFLPLEGVYEEDTCRIG